MSFAKGENVMDCVEGLIWHLREQINACWRVREVDGELVPTQRLRERADERHPLQALDEYPLILDKQGGRIEIGKAFPRITYQEAMSRYGSDKPDLRIPNEVCFIAVSVPTPTTSLTTHRYKRQNFHHHSPP